MIVLGLGLGWARRKTTPLVLMRTALASTALAAVREVSEPARVPRDEGAFEDHERVERRGR